MPRKIYIEPKSRYMAGLIPGRKLWLNGCACDGWKSCAPKHIKYVCYWDERYTPNMKIIRNLKKNAVSHEWAIGEHLIEYCPWCGKKLPQFVGLHLWI